MISYRESTEHPERAWRANERDYITTSAVPLHWVLEISEIMTEQNLESRTIVSSTC